MKEQAVKMNRIFETDLLYLDDQRGGLNMKNRMRIVGYRMPLFLVVVASFTVTFYFAMYGFDPHHDGFMFKTALDVSRGLTMYKDTYSQYGVLTIFIQAAFIKIFGEKVWAIKVATVVMYVISYIALYFINRKFLSRISAMFVCLVTLAMAPFYFWVFLPWSSVYSLAFLLISAYGVITYFERKQELWLIVSSIAGVCCFLCRQPVGIVAILAFYVVLAFLFVAGKVTFKESRKPLFIYSLACVTSCILTVAVLLLNGAFEDFWIQNIVYMLRFRNVVGGAAADSLKKIWDSLLTRPANSLSYQILPFCCIAAVLYLFVKTAVLKVELTNDHMAVFIFSIYGIASWHQYYPVTCLRHMFWAAFPMFGVTVYVLKEMVQSILGKLKFPNPAYELAAILLVGAVLYPDLKYRYDCAMAKVNMPYIYAEGKDYGYLDGLKLTGYEAEFYSELHAVLKELENKYGDKPVTNVTRDGYYACFYPENYQPQFNDWGDMNVYDD